MQIKERVELQVVDVEGYDNPWEVPPTRFLWDVVHDVPRLKTAYSQREAAELLQGFIKKHELIATADLLNTGTVRFNFKYPDLTCWLNKRGEFWIKKEDEQDHPKLAHALCKLLTEEPTNTEEEEQTMSEKNAAAFLRNDTKTVGVRLMTESSPTKEYTYVTTQPLAVDDIVVVPAVSDQNFVLAKVTRVDEKLAIEPRSGQKYKWVAAKVDLAAYQATLEANSKLEDMIADSYRKQAQVAYREQLLTLAGDNAELRALIGNGG